MPTRPPRGVHESRGTPMIGPIEPPSVPPPGRRSFQIPPGLVGGIRVPPPRPVSGPAPGTDVVDAGSGRVPLAVAVSVADAGSLRGRVCGAGSVDDVVLARACEDRKSTRLNS